MSYSLCSITVCVHALFLGGLLDDVGSAWALMCMFAARLLRACGLLLGMVVSWGLAAIRGHGWEHGKVDISPCSAQRTLSKPVEFTRMQCQVA